MLTIEKTEYFSTYDNTLKTTRIIKLFNWKLFVFINSVYAPEKNPKLNKSED